MSPENQQIAIAEACGWHHRVQKSPIDGRLLDMWEPPGQMRLVATCPDYLHDLNAMHEAEKLDILSSNAETYDYWLGKFTLGYAWHATAAQRAEAFLRTIGK